MNKEELIKLIEIRANLIQIYNDLPGKNEPSSLVKSKDVAYALAQAIKGFDRVLEGNVNFESGDQK